MCVYDYAFVYMYIHVCTCLFVVDCRFSRPHGHDVVLIGAENANGRKPSEEVAPSVADAEPPAGTASASSAPAAPAVPAVPAVPAEADGEMKGRNLPLR